MATKEANLMKYGGIGQQTILICPVTNSFRFQRPKAKALNPKCAGTNNNK